MSEGYPGARYFPGVEVIDRAERLCQQRALETFNLNDEDWGVNVQCRARFKFNAESALKTITALSGTSANLSAFSALLDVHDRIMGLDLAHGGHLSHGFQSAKKKVSATAKYFESFLYRVDEKSGLIDYSDLQNIALRYRPKLIIAGASAYPRLIDYARMRAIADSVHAYLLSDMAHISGLVAAEAIPSPFQHSDVVTTTTNKSLRGPRGGMIFYRKGLRRVNAEGEKEWYSLENVINGSVFPGHHGSSHNHVISALAVALRQAQTPEFRSYGQSVIANARVLADRLSGSRMEGGHGYTLLAGGTDNHLMVLDLRDRGVDGARVERVLELISVAANKNTIPGDRSAMKPHGIRLGSPAMTTRGFQTADFVRAADVVDHAIRLTQRIASDVLEEAASMGHKNPASFKSFYDLVGNGDKFVEIHKLRTEVENWVGTYPVPWEAQRTDRR